MGILKLVEVSENFREQVLEYKDEFDNNNEIVHWRDGDGWHYNIKNDNVNQIIEDLLAR